MILHSLAFLIASSSLAQAQYPTGNKGKWNLKQFDSLITFGDSYTDENRLGYFINNDGQPPPPGTYLNESLVASSGGRIWARYVVQYTPKSSNPTFVPQLRLYNYAVSGAVCSNQLSPRTFSAINQPFPDLDGYEVPAFIADQKARDSVTGKPYFDPPLRGKNAVFAIWDGTNDVGNDAFLTDSQKEGTTLVDFTNCIWTQMDRLYKAGARYFVLMNLVPLERAPQYATLEDGGVEASRFWANKPEFLSGNVTAIAEKMKEQVALVNNSWKYKLPYEALIANRYPGANFALYDVNRLFHDIIANPSQYLNGTGAPKTTGWTAQCDLTGLNCTDLPDRDAYLWFDELHPSEQADRIVANEFVNVIAGKGKYASYY